MSARTDILLRVRTALAAPRQSDETIRQEYAGIPREYEAAPALTTPERLELFRERLHDYDALVHLCSGAEVAVTVARILSERGKSGLLAAPTFPAAWLPVELPFNRDPALSYELLDRSEGFITDCALAIAVTGTIVLRHSLERGRRALSLVPDYLLCIIRAEQVVETVPEGIRRMAEFGGEALTTISGPSATADIEMTRIKGVHGPRTLEVVLVG